MKTIMVAFDTGQESIKMCPVIKELKKRTDVRTVVCVSGQYHEMLSQMLEAFGIEPDYNLFVMQRGHTLFEIVQTILDEIKGILEAVRPDIVLVHSGTASAYAAALACFSLNIPVGHVDAGLRTHNIKPPFPEEFNQECTGLITDLYFAPTRTAADNLISEGKDVDSVHITGNTSIDALRTTVQNGYQHEQLEWVGNDRLILLSTHWQENIGIPLENMLHAVVRIVNGHEDVKVIYPIQRDQAVKKIANDILGSHKRIRLVAPLNVLDFHNIMAASSLILTDSGKLQEEAPSLGKPVIVMRDKTERVEGVDAGTLKLVGTETELIYQAAHLILTDQGEYQKMSTVINPYGDGYASKRIVDILLQI